MKIIGEHGKLYPAKPIHGNTQMTQLKPTSHLGRSCTPSHTCPHLVEFPQLQSKLQPFLNSLPQNKLTYYCSVDRLLNHLICAIISIFDTVLLVSYLTDKV